MALRRRYWVSICCGVVLVAVAALLVQKEWTRRHDWRAIVADPQRLMTPAEWEEHQEVLATQKQELWKSTRGVVGLAGWLATDYFDDAQILVACDHVYRGDSASLEKLIDEGCDVNARGKCGLTLLHWALACNDLKCFQLLLQRGANPELPVSCTIDSPSVVFCWSGDTLVLTCARNGFSSDFLLSALKYCKNPNAKTAEGKTLISLARHKRLAFRPVLQAGADPNFSDSGQSGFVQALIGGDIEAIRILMEFKADPLLGDISVERLLEMIDGQISHCSHEERETDVATLTEFRRVVVQRSEEPK